MSQSDFYEILGVDRSASDDEIKRQYRKLAMQFHPDRNPDNPEAEQKFKEAAEAYDTLRDPERRANYDRYGSANPFGNMGGGFHSADDIFSSFGDIFGDLFGFAGASRGGRSRATPGNDLRYNLEITFMQAAKGAEIPITIPKNATCSECLGSGAAKGSKVDTCPKCKGSGQVRHNQGFFQISVPCASCGGTGHYIPNPCPKCKGKGVVLEKRELTVKVPAGVSHGSRLRIRSEGEAGANGGPNGDLYVVLNVAEDKRFERHGQDLIVRLEISFPQATLGCRAKVQALDGELELDISKGTQSGSVLRIAGEGLPYINEKRKGDLLVEVIVLTPNKLTERQEELLREFAQINSEDESLFNKIFKNTKLGKGKKK